MHRTTTLSVYQIEELNELAPLDQREMHRCRLYRIGPPNRFSPEGKIVEVWDTVEDPYEKHKALPPGELLAQEQDVSSQTVREKMSGHCERFKLVVAASISRWRPDRMP